MALNVDILSVNSLFINGVDILENKVDFVQLVGDEKIVIDVPSTTYTKAIPQIGVNLGDVELKTTPLDGKTFDTINNAGGVSVDGVSHTVDSVGCYVSNINIDSFVINKTSSIKSIEYTTYKWHDVDYGNYSLALRCDDLSEVSNNGLSLYGTGKTILNPWLGYRSGVITDSSNKKFGTKSYSFTGGSNNKLSITDGLNDFAFGTGDFTIEGWVNPTTYSYTSASVIWYSNNVCLSIYQGKFNCYIYGSGYVFSNPTKGVTYEWTHLALVRSGGIITLYVNGVMSDSVTYNNNISSPQLINIGMYGSSTEIYYGYIDEFRVSKVARYLEPFTPPTQLVGTDSNTIFYLDGEEIIDKTNAIITTSTDFQSGTASYEFNGTNYITAPSNTKYAFGTDDFTIELYTKVKYLDATYGTTILDNRPDNTNGAYWFIGMTKDGFLNISTNNTNIISGTTNQFNKWCHIALVRKDGVTSLYVNGIKEGSTSTLYSYSGDTFKIGRNAFYPTVPLLKGLIDDLRITKGLARYTTNFTPSTTLDTGTRPVKVAQHQGTIIQSELSYSDYLVSYGTAIDPWVAVQPSITVSGEPFTLIDSVITSSNTFTSTETLNVGDIISSDKETFGTIIFKELDEYMVDDDIFFDGVTDKPFTPSDVNIINFVQDKRSNLYTNGLRDALLSAVSSTIYGHINDEIIVDAGEGGSFVLGTMYTSGGYNDTDTTSKFSISTSNDGVDYTVVYENQENLMTNHSHSMTGTGRFIKITFLNEIGDWGRIITNIVGGKWWDLHIVHPMSKVYKYSAVLEVNGKSIVPDYIQWFDNMTINKIVCGKVFINPTTVLNINTENISKVELDLWQEVKGVI